MRLLMTCAAFAISVGTCGSLAQPVEMEVDVALVLAVDVSRSMDPEEQQLQRDGYAEAFRSEDVHDAIRKGPLGRIAISYFEWSGETEQKVVLPWTIIAGPAAAAEVAERLARASITRLSSTSISGAIEFGARLLRESGVTALRGVIDISGDGPNNSGPEVTAARDKALTQSITINGLPIMLKRATTRGDLPNLDYYFEDCVIGGFGAFIMPVRDRHHFAQAIRTKLVREIAGTSGRLIRRVQHRERSDCYVGEFQRGLRRFP